MLGDHFWPAMYPGVIVGLLVGLTGGNLLSAILGALGGLLGSMALYFVIGWTGLEEGVVSLAGMIGGAVAGAYLLMQAGDRIQKTS